MTIAKYRTLDEAQKAHWEFNPTPAYYQKLREMFKFLSQLSLHQDNLSGIFRYSSLQLATEQDMAWKVMAPFARYGEEKEK